MHSLGDGGCCTVAKTLNQPCCFQCNFWRKKCRMVQWTSASGMSIGIVWAAGYIQQWIQHHIIICFRRDGPQCPLSVDILQSSANMCNYINIFRFAVCARESFSLWGCSFTPHPKLSCLMVFCIIIFAGPGNFVDCMAMHGIAGHCRAFGCGTMPFNVKAFKEALSCASILVWAVWICGIRHCLQIQCSGYSLAAVLIPCIKVQYRTKTCKDWTRKMTALAFDHTWPGRVL